MKPGYLAGALIALAVPSAAFGHGASRLKVMKSIEINAPPAKVWKIIGDFHDMSWLPVVEKTTGTGGNDPQSAKRELTLKGGAKVEESLFKYDAAEMSYSYAIDKVDLKVLPVTNYSSTITVLPDGNKSKVEWRAAFFRGDPLFDPPPDLNDDAATKAVTGLYVSGLAALKKKVEIRRGDELSLGMGVRLLAAGVTAGLWLVIGLPAPPAAADEAFITDQSAGAVSVLDLSMKTLVATIAVGGKPAGIAMAPDGKSAYVTSPEGPYVSVIDTAARRVLRKIPVGRDPLGIAIDPAGNFIYVADFDAPHLYKVDVRTGQIVGDAQVGTSPCGVAVTPDGREIVVADRDEDQISILDAASFKRVAVVKTGLHPFGVTIDADGRRAYTANVKSNDVSIIDLAARKVIGTVKTGLRPYVVALNKTYGFVTDEYGGSVSVFDLASLKPLKKINVGDYPEGIEFSPDGKTLYVVNWFSNEVWAINSTTFKVTAKMTVGDGPRAFGTFIRKTP